ncbi:hypothetical protein [Mesoflavibacter zeaxanthinifaciens]|uniref:hypothetical protein n=1 Tax=Mesoflavibacter zeaxanthinifaciens TaxID=393060 RepID=UPI0026ED3E0E|nr:hypothetical protein [Mesoflavibacter zeaxanthinifaciens]
MHQNQIKIHYKNDIINIGNLDQRFAFFYYTKIYSRLYPDIIFSDLNIEETTKGRIFNYYPYKETSDQELETFIKSKEFGNDQTILSLLEKISVLNSNEKIFSILRHIVKLEKNRIIYNLIENLCIQAIGEIDIYSSRAKEELYFKKPTHNPNNFITNYSYQKIKEIQDKTSCFNMAYYDLVWILNLPIFSFFLEKYHNNLKITEDLITLEISPLFLSQKNWKTKISDEFLKISNEIDFERKKTTTIQALNNLEEKINHFSFPCFNDFINFKDVGFNDTCKLPQKPNCLKVE